MDIAVFLCPESPLVGMDNGISDVYFVCLKWDSVKCSDVITITTAVDYKLQDPFEQVMPTWTR